MILDARNSEVALERSADVAIVGAGPAGLILARELSDYASIILIESGGIKADPQVDTLQKGESIGLDYPLSETRARGFGGSSSIWAGYCAQFDRHDFLQRSWVANSGWPFGVEVLETYYSKVAGLLNLGGVNFDARDIARKNKISLPIDNHKFTPTVWRFGAPIIRFGDLLLKEFCCNPNITTFTNATVVDIHLDSEHSDVTRLIFRTMNGRQGVIIPKILVLACGGLETPRILLNADSQIKAGVGNDNDLVGRFFMEHPHFHIKPLTLTKPEAFTHWAERGDFDAGSQYLSCLGLSAVAQEALSVTNARLHLYRTPGMDGSETPFAGLFMEQAPNPDSRVSLSKQEDSLGMRRLQLNWRLNDLDRVSFKSTAQEIGAELVRNGLGRMSNSIHNSLFNNLSPLYSNHQLGTTRMAISPDEGVVDSNCCVHGLSNLYIAGGSVFPTVSWANPTFTLMSLVYRLADYLRVKLNSGKALYTPNGCEEKLTFLNRQGNKYKN
ncbi:GMC family oxidoreductase [Halomonas sp. ML-15]|uniref:GMC oxidoreductase n=1 Tax=Halomonas sp. ML-15 TaxID=2773305 RepID=UPI0017470A44|nr:GMC family oxidoreductase [Halomonas sp. ML-15]MBD3894531.1 GMC family oxidoreductase [Halomonas sp. ML-15]